MDRTNQRVWEYISKVRALMKKGFAQTPQLEGNATNRKAAIAY